MEATDVGLDELPGVPMPSGFTMRGPRKELPPERVARIQARIDDVNRCRLVAAEAGKTYVIGAK